MKANPARGVVAGDVADGYGKLADAFRRNLHWGKEIGAAFAVYRDGVKVVDLWGGYRNGITKAPWRSDTIVPMFSTTKGVSSVAVAVAASRGLLSYDARVADYWPGFAQAGKDEITVRQLLSHQAGLPVIDPPLALADVADPERLSAKIAAMAPAWIPGTRHGYHAVTLGWYMSELIRHADPAGRTVGRFFAEEIAERLGLEFYIGVPDLIPQDRLAHVHGWRRAEALLHLKTMPPRFVAALLNPLSLTARAARVPGLRQLQDINRAELQAVEMPAVNGTGTARSVAKLYGSVATGGSEIGMTTGTLDALHTIPTLPVNGLRDTVLHVDTTFSLGFVKPLPSFTFGSSDKAFGTPGAGGSFGFADPDTGVGYGYAMNRLGLHIWSDPRELALRQVLFRDILGTRPQV